MFLLCFCVQRFKFLCLCRQSFSLLGCQSSSLSYLSSAGWIFCSWRLQGRRLVQAGRVFFWDSWCLPFDSALFYFANWKTASTDTIVTFSFVVCSHISAAPCCLAAATWQIQGGEKKKLTAKMQSPKSTLKTLLPRPRLFIESALLADTAIIIMNYLLWKHTADRMKYPTVHIIRCKIKAWTLSTSSWQTAAEVSALKNRLESFSQMRSPHPWPTLQRWLTLLYYIVCNSPPIWFSRIHLSCLQWPERRSTKTVKKRRSYFPWHRPQCSGCLCILRRFSWEKQTASGCTLCVF